MYEYIASTCMYNETNEQVVFQYVVFADRREIFRNIYPSILLKQSSHVKDSAYGSETFTK